MGLCESSWPKIFILAFGAAFHSLKSADKDILMGLREIKICCEGQEEANYFNHRFEEEMGIQPMGERHTRGVMHVTTADVKPNPWVGFTSKKPSSPRGTVAISSLQTQAIGGGTSSSSQWQPAVSAWRASDPKGGGKGRPASRGP